MTYSHMGTPTLPSALKHFTSEFGMGSGGSTLLWSPGKSVHPALLRLSLLRIPTQIRINLKRLAHSVCLLRNKPYSAFPSIILSARRNAEQALKRLGLGNMPISSI